MKEIADKTTGSELTADEFTNGIKTEFQEVVSGTNQTFSEPNQEQFRKGLTRASTAATAYTCSGVADTYTLTSESPYTTFYPDILSSGMLITFIPIASNATATPSVEITSTTDGAKTIINADATPIVAGDIRINTRIFLVYNGTNWVRVEIDGQDTVLRNNLASQLAGVDGASLIGFHYTIPGSNNVLATLLNKHLPFAISSYQTKAPMTDLFNINFATITNPAGGQYDFTFTTQPVNVNYEIYAQSVNNFTDGAGAGTVQNPSIHNKTVAGFNIVWEKRGNSGQEDPFTSFTVRVYSVG